MSTSAAKTGRRILLSMALLVAALPLTFAGLHAATRPNSEEMFRLAATDGHIMLPGLDPVKFPDGLYIFGFVSVPDGMPIPEAIRTFKGNVQTSAPIIGVDQESNVTIRVMNLGFLARPDLDDAHTLHWHGFRNQISIFDGVPEVSIGVKSKAQFPYFFRPHQPGTYMYHCHFEDVEHVQMGMQGVVFVRPSQNGNTALYPSGKYVYNDGDGSTGYDREFTLMINELDITPHFLSEKVQEFVWTDYHPQYFTLNGRAYPDTVLPNDDPSLPSQPISSLIQANEGERILLRMANLGYEQQSMQLDAIRMHVVGEDATLLRGPAGADLSYDASAIYIGPGESRDVLFSAPAFDGSDPSRVFTDAQGDYNRYLFANRNLNHATNPGLSGLGGQVTEVRVYQDDLPDQTAANQLFP